MRPLPPFHNKVVMECPASHPLARRIARIVEDIDYRQRPIQWMIGLFRFGFGEPEDDGDRHTYDLPRMPEEYDSCLVRLVVKVVDITNPHPEADPITLFLPCMTIHPNFTDEQIVHFTYTMIRSMELHELDEHFFFHGVKVRDPHKSQKNKF
jgi:hypothetical protein